ncbi:uncharacterized protein PHALS_07706 [Plasmopara halstedii]|uniref:Uncharacterized protein n=1 Tax=Plasmopara halstedii TaxID=4781 RepID=A0A0P1B7N5_PLAHL|nr:uncharacterized protein PHALS_07706 [Plasmopara halstedii]CEG49973.1 hypothetical protein PHALS_07706 [Plasmopara halstedii]|eukprot:XP_024586342.1 hypothetical protein PHALS_07706 [Plasmopara halstedii]
MPTLECPRIFGSRGFVHIDKSKRSKLNAKAHLRLLLGCAEGSKLKEFGGGEAKRLVTTRTIHSDERVPFADVTVDFCRIQEASSNSPEKEVDERYAPPSVSLQEGEEDVEIENITVDDEAEGLVVDPP